MRIIAVANQKGGCGKTTTSINLSASLAHLEKKVLLIDLDPQGHSTCGLGVRAEEKAFTLYDLLRPSHEEKPGISAAITEINPYFYLLPSYGILAAIEEELTAVPNKEKTLAELIRSIEAAYDDFDFIILDCPPNLGMLTYNALHACDEILIPLEPSFFSLHGLAKMSETMAQMNHKRNRNIEIHALLTLFDSGTKFAEEVYQDVRNHFQEKLFKTVIHQNMELREAASAGQSIVDYAPHSLAFREYYHLAIEYLERDWNRRLPEKRLGWDNMVNEKYGPRRVPGGVLFQIHSKTARTVEIAGDFNSWIPEALVKRSDDGLWQKIISITQGFYRYKFIIDGEWQMDPYQPVQKVNDFGTFDSYLELV